ncbi:MAG: hypothetical protein KDD89_06315, partial [Anaerolineales bacterium]|nr:hypothetical protein [Anaerolineales bacterium]
RQKWLAVAVVAAALAFQIHLAAVALLPVSLVLVLLFWRRVSWRWLAVGVGLALSTAVPFLIYLATQSNLDPTALGTAAASREGGGLSLNAVWHTIRLHTGWEIHALAGPAAFQAYLDLLPTWVMFFTRWLWGALMLGGLGIMLWRWFNDRWLGVRPGAGTAFHTAGSRLAEREANLFVLVWLGGTWLTFLWFPTPVELHYLLPTYPTLFIAAGVCAAVVGRVLGWRLWLLLGMSGLAQAWGLLVLLTFVGQYATPGGFGVPLGRQLQAVDTAVALFTAVLLATSFWHLLFSRLGFRAISQPLWQALMLAAFLRGLRHMRHEPPSKSSWLWFAFSGVALGLTAYTYLAARLFPLLLALACWPLVLDRPTWRRVWRPILLLVGVALLVLAPLLWFFATHPEAFWVRISQVGSGTESLSLAESMGRSLAMFGWAGDPYWRFNIPGRPLLPWLWFGLGLVGWVLAGWRAWRTEKTASQGRVAYLLLLLNPLVMLLPTALATNEIVPSNLRAIGLLPLLMVWPALAGVALLDRVVVLPSRAWLGGFTAVLFIGAGLTAQVYFNEWATRTDLFYENDGDLAAVAAYLNERGEGLTRPWFIGSRFYQHPTVALLAEPYEDLRWLIESRALVVPADGQATYLIPASSPLPVGLQRLLATANPVVEQGPDGPDGEPLFTRYTISQSPVISPSRPLNANFAYGVTLLGADVGSGAAGTTLPLTLYWRVDGPPPSQPDEAWVPFVHLEDTAEYRWSQQEPNPYPTTQWQVGEIIVQEVAVALPPGMPPGRYAARVGLFVPSTGAALARFDEAGRYAGSGLTLGDVIVSAGDGSGAGEPDVVLNTAVLPDNQLVLIGQQGTNWQLSSGEAIELELWWQASGSEPLPYLTSRFELLRPNNTGIILADTQPAQGKFPFVLWPTPQFVRDRQTLATPDELAPGTYRLQLRVLSADDQSLLVQPLGEVTLTASERSFVLPDLPNFEPLDAVFGEEVALRGYAIEGQQLTLVWQAVAEPSTDYTAFVHILNADGTCCLWQADLPPADRGTSQWQVGEVLTRTYQVAIPEGSAPGTYALEVGLYVAENGQRLAVETTAEHGLDFVYLRPWVINEQ